MAESEASRKLRSVSRGLDVSGGNSGGDVMDTDPHLRLLRHRPAGHQHGYGQQSNDEANPSCPHPHAEPPAKCAFSDVGLAFTE